MSVSDWLEEWGALFSASGIQAIFPPLPCICSTLEGACEDTHRKPSSSCELSVL